MLAELAMMAAMCAPNVHVSTMQALVKHESEGNPYAIGINKGAPRLKKQPRSKTEAITIAKNLMKRGVSFDAGWGQITIANWEWLGLTPETVFEPCTNLKAAQTVLVDCYQRATKQYAAGQPALMAGLSCYNTGNFTSGFSNGYVNKVLASAGIKVPSLEKSAKLKPAAKPKPGQADKPKKSSMPDGFGSNPIPDGFQSNPVTDSFELLEDADPDVQTEQETETDNDAAALDTDLVVLNTTLPL